MLVDDDDALPFTTRARLRLARDCRLSLLLLLLLLIILILEHVNLKCRRLALPPKKIGKKFSVFFFLPSAP